MMYAYTPGIYTHVCKYASIESSTNCRRFHASPVDRMFIYYANGGSGVCELIHRLTIGVVIPIVHLL